MKACSQCGDPQPLENFHRDKNKPGGRRAECKQCISTRRKLYGKANRDKLTAKTLEWRERNPDRYREIARASDKRVYHRDIETGRARSRKKARLRRIRRAQCSGSHTWKEWQDIVKQYGNQCLKCHTPGDANTLTEDHVVPISKGGSDYIDNIQPLCKSCNSSKHDNTEDYR